MKNGLPPVSRAIAFGDLDVDVLLGEHREQPAHRELAEPLEPDELHLGLTRQLVNGVRERMSLGEVGRAIQTDDEQPLRRRGARDATDHRDGARVGPVEIVQDDEHRRPFADGVEEAHHGFGEPVALFVRLHGRRRERIRERRPYARRQLPEDAGQGADLAARDVGGHGVDVVVERLDERTERRRPLALVARAPEDEPALSCERRRDLFRDAGLADARLPGDEGERTGAVPRGLAEPDERAQLLRAADVRRARRQAPRSDVVRDLERRHRIRDPLELELAESRELESASSAQHAGDEVAAQDLSALRGVAQPARDDDGRADVVGLVLERLADVDADADAQAFAVDRPPCGSLHRDRGANGGGGGRERHHQPVTRPLDVPAPVGAGGLLRGSRGADAGSRVPARRPRAR